MLSRKCQGCGLTSANILGDEFSCRGLTNHIIYRAMIIGTSVYSPIALVSLLQSWVSSGTAYIDVDTLHLKLDEDCDVQLDTLRDPDCPLVTEAPPTEPPSTPTTTELRTTQPPPIKTTEGPRVVSNALEGVLTTGDIGGILVAIVIIALIVVLLVALLVIVIKWRSTTRPKSYNA